MRPSLIKEAILLFSSQTCALQDTTYDISVTPTYAEKKERNEFPTFGGAVAWWPSVTICTGRPPSRDPAPMRIHYHVWLVQRASLGSAQGANELPEEVEIKECA
ncbi:hypothetical protein EDB83DRAFT_2431187 [Lactarius deliciosus]|nr:hypothetical protein EDB83DRAFT_2431187 [Lactarius deliciosus]